MHVVAITRLGCTVEEEAKALAADLGTTAYEERLKLVVGLPAIVLSTADESRATSLSQALRKRGHGVVSLDADALVNSEEMISLRRFQFDNDALVAAHLPDTSLPWTDIASLLRATQRRRTTSVDVVQKKEFSLGRAIASGGLILNKTTKKEVSTVSEQSEPVLFVFRHSGETPWILHERGTNYAGLGDKLNPVAMQNFGATVEQLRKRAPQARFDDRLMKRKGGADEIDLLAHVLAAAIAAGIS